MASDALQHIDHVKASSLQNEYGNKLSNKFVAELKGSNLFLCNWGELLSAAPTALALMGSCWLAAATPTAEKISLSDAKPEKGFQFMTNVPNPTLRSCLVDVCNNGGRRAFTVAGENMDALHITSKRICDERILAVFQRLGRSTSGEDAYEDFKDSLDDFSNDAKMCANLAREIREAFGTWGKMVGELNAATENQAGLTAINANDTELNVSTTKIQETYAIEHLENARKQIIQASKKVEIQQKNLDIMINKVPGGWVSVLQTCAASVAQTVPAIIGAAVLNPSSVAAGQAGNTSASQFPTSQPKKLDDPAYATAVAILEFVNLFYEFMGGDTGPINWDKFKEEKTAGAPGTAPQGSSYILGTLKGQRQNIEETNTEPNKKLLSAYDDLIYVATKLQEYLGKQNQITAEANPADTVVKEWKGKCKKARNDVLQLAATARAMGSTSGPVPFGNVQLPTPDLSAQTAQLNTAMQGVQITQNALENAEKAYEDAIDKQEKAAKQMSDILAKLEELRKRGKTLQEIKEVLRDCIKVLVDLIIQINKLEQFFTMLQTIIDHIVMPRARDFEKELGKAGSRAMKSGVLRVDDISKETIYIATLQLKAYFSLLQDISEMYSIIHRDHILNGVDLCYQLSKGTASNDPMLELQEQLASYTDKAAKKVAAIVSKKQQEILGTLRERARKAKNETQMIDAEILKFGVAIDQSAKNAIKAGAEEQKAAAHHFLSKTSGPSSEQIDASSF